MLVHFQNGKIPADSGPFIIDRTILKLNHIMTANVGAILMYLLNTLRAKIPVDCLRDGLVKESIDLACDTIET